MADSRGIKKPSATETVEQTAHQRTPTTTDPKPDEVEEQEEETPPNRSTTKSPSQEAQFWSILVLYTICCIALSVILAVVIDGFNAGDSSTPRYIHGKLQLRVSDITTLVSAGLVVIKLLLTFWTGVAVWRCAFELTHTRRFELTLKRLSFMARYKLPPSLRWPFELPKGHQSWIASIILLFVLPSQLIAPLLSGAVNWDPTTVPGTTTVLVNSTNPLAAASLWYQYVLPDYVDERSQVFKAATGLASLPWSSGSTLSQNGTSLTGNGCRHIVPDDGLPQNSTLRDSIMPCIKFHNISWATSKDQISDSLANNIFQTQLSILDDDISHYTNPGHAVLFDPDHLWDGNSRGYDLPSPTVFSGTKVLALNIANTYDCSTRGTNNFGAVQTFPQHVIGMALGTCYIFANVTLTAGVTTSRASTYLSSRVVEDQTPLDEVKFEPSPWVEQSLWLLPDMMTMISLANSSQVPTWNNLDLYAENLIRQSYLAAWEGLHQAFDEGPEALASATPAVSRVKAAVSYARVFSWLGISLLTTVAGILLFALTYGEKEVVDSTAEENEESSDVVGLLNDISGLGLF
ncbi:hypothetical protein VTL71DRAFT_9510 [Oculimacula yallundae]|uniref:Transmembrane protein n=1 Tax=Oculimacula yallundae TaxID=86028 RepID=A0ABR4BS47_9HELO